MAVEKVINITVNTKGGTQAIAQTEKLNAKFKQLNQTTGELKGGLKESGNAILENGGAMGLLNDATGGLAMSVKDAVEATGLFTKGTVIATTAQKAYAFIVGGTTGALKALRLALAATGLGAILVLVGFLVTKMMELSDATEEQRLQQEALNKTLDETNKLYKESITDIQDVTKERVLRAKIAGKSEKELQEIENDANKERRQNYLNERDRLLKLLDDRNLSAENAEKINKQLSENQREYWAFINSERVKDLEGELSTIEAKRQAQKDALAKQLEDRKKAEEERRKQELEFQKSVSDGLIALQIATNEAEFEQRALNLENKKAQVTEIERLFEQETQKEAEELEKRRILNEAVENAKRDIAFRTSDLIAEIAGKDSKIGKGVAVAQATISGIEGVQNAFTTAQKSPVTVAFPAYPYIQAGLAGAFSLLQIKKILSTDPTGKSAAGGGGSSVSGGGAAAPAAPSFNLIQGTGSNQIAEGLATQRQPLQAYVVAQNVTSAQSLQRNIINDASI